MWKMMGSQSVRIARLNQRHHGGETEKETFCAMLVGFMLNSEIHPDPLLTIKIFCLSLFLSFSLSLFLFLSSLFLFFFLNPDSCDFFFSEFCFPFCFMNYCSFSKKKTVKTRGPFYLVVRCKSKSKEKQKKRNPFQMKVQISRIN